MDFYMVCPKDSWCSVTTEVKQVRLSVVCLNKILSSKQNL